MELSARTCPARLVTEYTTVEQTYADQPMRALGPSMARNQYSHFESLPTGRASNDLTEGCLVLEGGAFRGLYTQGVTDLLMLRNINFSCVIGVSAGALGGVGYVSGQIGRSARINIGYRHDARYIGVPALIRSHSILDVGFLTEERGITEPLDAYVNCYVVDSSYDSQDPNATHLENRHSIFNAALVNLFPADDPVAIKRPNIDEALTSHRIQLTVTEEGINVSNLIPNETVRIMTADGFTIGKQRSTSSTLFFPLTQKGVYILTSDEESFKFKF